MIEGFPPERFNSICEKLFSFLPAGCEAEVHIFAERQSLTRFTNNFIHQNVSSENTELRLRVINGKRVGVASSNKFDEQALKRVVELAYEGSKFAPADEELQPLLPPQRYRENPAYFQSTAQLTPEQRAEYAGYAFKEASARGFEVAGIISNSASFKGIANSIGLRATHTSTDATFSLTVDNKRDGKGWASWTGSDVEKLPFQAVTARALMKAEMNVNPIELPPGEYRVILEPAAVAELLDFAVYMGFGAQSYLDGRSFLVGKLGKRVFDEKITVVDTPFNEIYPGQPFDYEGMPREELILVENGVAKALAHDRITARKMGTRSTGHSLPQPNTWGPIPFNAMLLAGKSSLEDMISSTEHGLLVTHFHYTNVIEPRKLVLTGMTRDGLFLVENGKITGAVKNLRFTESLVRAFNEVEMVGDKLEFDGFVITPALKLTRFRFSSGTEF